MKYLDYRKKIKEEGVFWRDRLLFEQLYLTTFLNFILCKLLSRPVFWDEAFFNKFHILDYDCS